MEDNKISAPLKQLREERKLTAKEAVEKLKAYGFDISEKTLYGYENGVRMPNSDIFMALCDIYQVHDILAYFGYKREEKPTDLSGSEYSLVKKYRNLDVHGKEVVNSVLEIADKGNRNQAGKPHLLPIAAHNEDDSQEELEKMRRDLEDL